MQFEILRAGDHTLAGRYNKNLLARQKRRWRLLRRRWRGRPALTSRRPPIFEPLEDRVLFSTVTVSNVLDVVNGTTTSIAALIASDGGDGISLREAITAANADSGVTDTIAFNIAGGGPHTITPGSALPNITDTIIIDGETEPDFSTPVVELDGSSAGAVDGLTLATGSGGSIIRGLVINQFTGSGIQIDSGSNGNTIEGNYIGTDVAGTAASANIGGGIDIASNTNTIGGIVAADRNIISGNTGNGILITGDSNVVEGNYIGLDVTGATDLGNLLDGIEINGGASNTIGGTTAGERNVISGNDVNGIYVTGAGATGNQIQGNYIGLDEGGTLDRGNTSMGVLVDGSAATTTVGGTAAGAGNVISGNDDKGVQISSGGAAGNTIQGNYVGTDFNGTADVGNTNEGIEIINSDSVTIGGTVANERNVIAGNNTVGIDIDGSSSGTVIEGNYVGIGSDGSTALGNSDDNILVQGTSSNTTIGGTTAGERNIISSSTTGDGIDIRTDGNTIQGNYIGTDSGGTLSRGNATHGIVITSDNNDIGGTAAGAGNLIANNSGDGIALTGTATGNALLRNAISGNTGLGIDFDNNGVTANDVNDPDAGVNGLQNFPVLNAIATDGAGFFSVDGTLDTDLTNQDYRIEFFTNATGDASGNGEGEIFVTAITVTTDGFGDATFRITLSATAATGTDISATATVDLGAGDYGSTSEFAAHVAATTGDLTVTNTNDSNNGDTSSVAALIASNGGDGISIREAITAANNTTNTDTIAFSITGGGPHTIDVDPQLPAITDTVVIDGTTEPSFVGTPLVVLDSDYDSSDGLRLSTGSDGSTIRGLVIMRMTQYGISIDSDNNVIEGNYIGVDATGTVDRGNSSDGIRIMSGADTNTIGGTTAAQRNVISGNNSDGIEINGASGTIIEGNYIGLTADGSTDLGNSRTGVYIHSGATSTTIGGTTTSRRNVISGNNVDGVEINNSDGNTVSGNYIGLDATGALDRGNSFDGVWLNSGADSNTIGGNTAAERNVISGNNDHGVYVNGGDGNIIQGNYIGTDQGGTVDLGNTDDGVEVDNGATNTTIGGTTSGTGNLISGNNAGGIYFSAAGAVGNVVKGNLIGTDFNGTADLGNSVDGIETINSDNITIGGITALERNVISGNGDDGIEFDTGSDGIIVQGNYIGLGSDGTTAIGNDFDGFLIQSGSTTSTIGGTTAAERNVISSNGDNGIILQGDTHTIRGNFIGTDVTGTLNRGNTGHGITISNGADNNDIGGTATGAGNAIWYNGGDGVSLDDTNTGNAILGNSIDKNTGLGIDLSNNGVTGNDGGDGDTGANGRQNFPVITAAVTDGTQITLTGTLNSANSTTYRIEFFWSPTGDAGGNGEGPGWLGTTSVTTDGSGNGTFTSVALSEPIAPGADITATATVDLGAGDYGDSSEFSANFAATDSGAGILVVESTTDVLDGTVTSIAALFAARGADGVISLREAITAANNTAGTDTIYFNIPDPFVTEHNITPGAALPNISQATVIDATTEPDYVSAPIIELDGNSAVADGLTLATGSGGSTIRGLVINLFTDNGIQIDSGSNSNTVAGNYIGTDVAGTAASANAGHGISVGSNTNTIGGTVAADLNIISGNTSNGIHITGDGNIVEGNYIGLDVTGASDLGNTLDGIEINGGMTNTIGGVTSSERNIISGNNANGIHVTAVSSGNTIEGNYIGLNQSGTLDRGNTSNGILVDGTTTTTTIGGTTAGERNVISGNNNDGIRIDGATTTTIEGNYIGLVAAGTTTVGNSQEGVSLLNTTTSTTIGGSVAGAGNVISGNGDNGVEIAGTSTSTVVRGNTIGLDAAGTTDRGNTGNGVLISTNGIVVGGTSSDERNIISGNNNNGVHITGDSNTVEGNYIGLDTTGATDLGNSSDGIEINGGATNTIGGTTAAERNVTSGNNDHGIHITGAGSTGNMIEGNYIGLDQGGTVDRGNSNDGVLIDSSAATTTIGGTTAGASNVISGNDDNGIRVNSGGAAGQTIQGNLIGTDFNGTADLGNTDDGININNSNNVTIGGTVANTLNTISGNNDQGIDITGSSSTTIVEGNYIGLGSDGSTALGNSDDGIRIQGTSSSVTIGGNTSAHRNVISSNGADGIDNQTNGHTIQGNYIGLDSGGSLARGNTGHGINIISDNNLIGGDTAGDENTIANNTLDGIAITGSNTGNSLLRNLIYSNSGLGIDLANDGVTGNDANDSDGGDNNLQNFPVITEVDIDTAAQITIVGTLDTDLTSQNYRIEFFRNTIATGQDGSGSGEGETFLGAITVMTDGSGDATFNSALSVAVSAGEFITATATVDLGGGNYGNTSEFAINVTAQDINDAPAGANSTESTAEDTDLVFVAGDFGFTDTSDIPADVLLNVIIATTVVVGTLYNDADLDGIVDGGETLSALDTVSATDIGLGQLKFKPVADANGTSYASFTFQVQDNGGTANGGVDTDQSANTMTIDVTSVNDIPVVTLPGAAINFTEDDGATIIDGGATVTDVDSADFDTGTLTIDFTANGTANDRLAINDQGAGVGNISLSGANVTYDFGAGAITIGTFAGGTDGSTPLVITFNASATPVSVQALARQITFNNVSQDPSALARTVRFVAVDGDSGTSTAVTETINVAKTNDAPVVTLPGAAINFTEDDGATIIDGGATVTDVDSADFDTGTLTIDFTANGTANDRLAINDQGAGVGNISLSGANVTYDFGAGAITIGTFAGGTDGSTPLVITFNASATPVAAQALARQITFNNVSQDPSALARTVRFVAVDGDSGTSTAVTETINVAKANDAPVVTLPGAAINFTEDDGATIIDGGATVTDVDSADFDTGTLTIDFTANGTANDRLAINDQGAGVGNISLSGANVTYDFGAGAITIGTFAGGTDGSTPLVITFNASATPVAAQALARQITFNNVSQDPSALARTVRFVAVDGDSGTSTAVTETINVAKANDAPVVTLPGAAINFTEDDGATIIDGGATVTDVDSADFDTGTLTIDFTANGTANDRLAINDQGAGVGNISLSGANVTYDFGAGAITIGTFAGGTDGSTPLVITFNASATPVSVQALARQITFNNVSQDPSALARTVRFVAVDGDSGTSTAVTETINVAKANDAPVVTLPGAAINFTEDDGATIIDGGATVTDVDSADFDTGTLTIDFTANGTANDRLAINDQGAGVGNISLSGANVTYDFGAGAITIGTFAGGTDGSTPLVITFNASATPVAAQALARQITFNNVSQDPSALARTVRFVAVDGDSGTSTAVTETINVAKANDAPVVTLPGAAINFTEDDGATIIDGGATVTDVDSADFDTGTLTIDFTANGTANDRLAINDQGAGVGNISLSGANVTYDFGAGAITIGTFAGGTDGSTPLVITFNASATPVAAQALARQITFNNVSQDPSALARTVRFVAVDGDSGTSTAVTETINVAKANDAPVVTLPGAAINFTEDDGATIIDGGATVTDVDSADFDTGTLTIDFTANGTANDRLAINDQGAGVGNISLSGANVTYDFGAGAITIGTFAGGTDGSTPLVITFNASATPVAAQALARQITFNNVSQDPSALARTVRFVAVDGDSGTSTAVTETINVAKANDAPVVTLPGAAINFTEDDGATIIDGGATVTDVDSADFDTGTLTIDFTANGTANDRLAINDQGAGVGNISLSGANVTYDFGAGAITIGTFAGGTDGSTPLVITFNASATPVSVQALARQITFNNVSQDPSALARTVRFVAVDGDSGTSTAVTETINVAKANDAPVVTLPGAAINFTEDDGATIIDGGATVTDVDSADFDTGTLTIDFTANGTANDRLAINDQGAGVGNISLSGANVTYDFGAGAITIGTFAGGTDGSTPLVITFNASATPVAAQALARQITFNNVSQDPSALARTVRFVAVDGDSGTSTAVTETINVAKANDAPVVTLPGAAINFTEDDGATIIDGGATVTDVDSADFDTGTLTIDFTANGTANDRLAINDQGAGVGNISLSGANVTYDFGAGAITIGTFAGGTDGSTPLVITFNASATPVAAQALARQITFNNVSQDPSALARTVRFVAVDGDSGTSTAVTETINVAKANDAPVVTLPGAAINFTEDDGATIIDGGATVTDVDSADFDTGTLTIDFTANGTANDRLAINDQGAGVGNISLSGANVTYDFGAGAITIGTFAGGTDGSTPLVITFNASATPVAAQALARQITFNNVSQDPSALARTVRFVAVDGDSGTSTAVTETINVAKANDAPVVTLPGAAINFTEDDGATIIDGGATVTDVDSADFDTGTLTIDFTANGTANDRLAINDQGAGVGNISLSGANVTYDFGAGAITIGTFAGGTDGSTPLVITFNASATPVAAQALARQITFNNVSQDPSALARTVRFVAVDGDSGTSTAVTETINVAKANDAPVLDNGGAMVLPNINENNFTSPGETVANIIASAEPPDRITDVDAGAVEGIAVIGVDDTNGQWQYDDGGGFAPFGAVLNTSAVLLDGTSRIRFVPNLNYNGSAGNITFRAWDITAGTDGDTSVDVSTNGTTTPYSTITETATLTVIAVNNAPTLDNGGAMVLTDITEDDVASAGDTVGNIIASAEPPDRIMDVDAGAVEGIAVIGVDDTNGQWQYDDGGGFAAFGAVMNTSAVLLDTTSLIRFVPNADYNGSAGNITFRAWDRTSGLDGDTGVNVSSNGGITAYSTVTETATLTVLPGNDAPVNSVPGSQGTDQNTALVLSTGNGNLFSISDIDAGGGIVQVMLTATNGTLTLPGTAGLAFGVGDGTADVTMTFTGTMVDINTALDGLTFDPTPAYFGPATIQIITDDQGNVGSGGALNDNDTVNITVFPPFAISGRIYEDVDGDGAVLDDNVFVAGGVSVDLYQDDGDGVPDAGDTFLANTTADVTGFYFFTNLFPNTYWVVVDSKTVDPSGGFNATFNQGDVWAEQTYGAVESVSFSGTFNFSGADGIFYGGMQSEVSDDTAALITSEHVNRKTIVASSISNVDFGFSFNTITRTGDGDDDGGNNRTVQGSLRQFIQNGNAIVGTNSSQFAIPTTDTNFNGSGNGEYTIIPTSALPIITDAIVLDGTTQSGYVGTPLIELDGSGAGGGVDGIAIDGGSSTVRGFVINQFGGDGIVLTTNGSNTIVSNYIGTDVTGLIALGNGGSGVQVDAGSSGNTIGGTVLSDGNIIANNAQGVRITNAASVNNTIQGNTIHSNTNLGIDLQGGTENGFGVTANDVGVVDADAGPNGLQNYPVLTTVASDATQTLVEGTFDSTANTTFRLEFYRNTIADGSGHGEASTFLGFLDVMTDGTGMATFSTIYLVSVALGEFVTATATDPSGNTSEFALNATVININVGPTNSVPGDQTTRPRDGIGLFSGGW